MLIIGIAGGTGSGKTTVVKKIVEKLPSEHVTVISQDSYYRDNSHLPADKRQEINFDHPSSLEFTLLEEHVRKLKKGEGINQPVYSYLSCTRLDETVFIMPKKILIIEGILVLCHEPLRNLMDLKIYVDADADERLRRVINRDITERGRTLIKVLERYEKTVKPMHIQFVAPTKRFADIVIPGGGNNQVAISLMKSYIEWKLGGWVNG